MDKLETPKHQQLEPALEIPQDPPPPYEAAEESTTLQPGRWNTLTASARGVYKSLTSTRPKHAGLDIRCQQAPLQVLPPDPRSIRCCCGRYVDTTTNNQHLGVPGGRIRCWCGHLVSSDGAAHHPDRAGGSTFPGYGVSSSSSSKTRLDSNFYCEEGVENFSEVHNLHAPNLCKVRCPCGKQVDTMADLTIKHRGEKGSSEYQYTLPFGVGRCSCGRIVRRDGSVVAGHSRKCCKVRVAGSCGVIRGRSCK